MMNKETRASLDQIFSTSFRDTFEKGYEDGKNEGYQKGYQAGCEEYCRAKECAFYESGREAGKEEGYNKCADDMDHKRLEVDRLVNVLEDLARENGKLRQWIAFMEDGLVLKGGAEYTDPESRLPFDDRIMVKAEIAFPDLEHMGSGDEGTQGKSVFGA